MVEVRADRSALFCVRVDFLSRWRGESRVAVAGVTVLVARAGWSVLGCRVRRHLRWVIETVLELQTSSVNVGKCKRSFYKQCVTGAGHD